MKHSSLLWKMIFYKGCSKSRFFKYKYKQFLATKHNTLPWKVIFYAWHFKPRSFVLKYKTSLSNKTLQLTLKNDFLRKAL